MIERVDLGYAHRSHPQGGITRISSLDRVHIHLPLLSIVNHHCLNREAGSTINISLPSRQALRPCLYTSILNQVMGSRCNSHLHARHHPVPPNLASNLVMASTGPLLHVQQAQRRRRRRQSYINRLLPDWNVPLNPSSSRRSIQGCYRYPNLLPPMYRLKSLLRKPLNQSHHQVSPSPKHSLSARW